MRSFPRVASILLAPALALALTPPVALADDPDAPEPVESSVDASWSAGTVRVGETATVTGTISPADTVRHVELEARTEAGWTDVAVQSTQAGAFAFALPTGQADTRTFRVLVTASPTAAEAVSEPHVLTVAKHRLAVSVQESRRRAHTDDRVTLSGRVSGMRGRHRVQLVQVLPGTDRVVGRATTRGSRFTFRLPTDWYHRHTFRVRVPATPMTARSTSPLGRVRVVPSYDPPGSSRSWSRLTGERWRFDPCQTLVVRMNPSGAPKGALKDVQGTLARVTQATGLRFEYAGGTRYVPWATRPGRWTKGTHLVIAWSDDRRTPALSGSVAGVGGVLRGYSARDAQGPVAEVTEAGLTLDTSVRLEPGFGSPADGWNAARGQLLMHEVLHALGGGHTDGAGQIMRPTLTNDPARWGAGDLTILNKIGLASGCITSSPSARAAAVEVPEPEVVRIGR
jgi:hypothetical protein